MNTTHRNRILTTLALAAALAVAAPTAAVAAPPTPNAQIISMACGYRTEYRWNDFSCWVLVGSPPSRCYYRVYSCS